MKKPTSQLLKLMASLRGYRSSQGFMTHLLQIRASVFLYSHSSIFLLFVSRSLVPVLDLFHTLLHKSTIFATSQCAPTSELSSQLANLSFQHLDWVKSSAMASFQPSTRIVTLIIVILAALTCTLFSLVCLGHDATIAALTGKIQYIVALNGQLSWFKVSVTAIVLSGIGIIMLTFFITDKKPCQSDVVLNTVRSNFQHDLQLTDRPPLPPCKWYL